MSTNLHQNLYWTFLVQYIIVWNPVDVRQHGYSRPILTIWKYRLEHCPVWMDSKQGKQRLAAWLWLILVKKHSFPKWEVSVVKVYGWLLLSIWAEILQQMQILCEKWSGLFFNTVLIFKKRRKYLMLSIKLYCWEIFPKLEYFRIMA